MGRSFNNKPLRYSAKAQISIWAATFFLLACLIGFGLFSAIYRVPQSIPGLGLLVISGEIQQIISPWSGTIDSFFKEEGDKVQKGDIIAQIYDHEDVEKKKDIISGINGVIAEIIAYAGTSITIGEPIAIVTHHGDVRKDLELIGFVSLLDGKKLVPGLKVLISPAITSPRDAGYLVGSVKRVGKLPMSKAAVRSVVKIPEVAKYIRNNIESEPFLVYISLVKDSHHRTGYQWTKRGSFVPLDSGLIADFLVIYEERSLFSLLLPAFERR